MGFDNLVNGIVGTITANPLASVGVAAASGVVIGGAGVGLVSAVASKKRKKRRTKTKRTGKRNSNSKRKRYSRKHLKVNKRTSHKRIRYTKKGQPYIIKANGRAQFIKKSSAKSSKKRKGGRY